MYATGVAHRSVEAGAEASMRRRPKSGRRVVRVVAGKCGIHTRTHMHTRTAEGRMIGRCESERAPERPGERERDGRQRRNGGVCDEETMMMILVRHGEEVHHHHRTHRGGVVIIESSPSSIRSRFRVETSLSWCGFRSRGNNSSSGTFSSAAFAQYPPPS